MSFWPNDDTRWDLQGNVGGNFLPWNKSQTEEEGGVNENVLFSGQFFYASELTYL